MFNGVFIIPTGIGCEIGGHSGDATPSAILIASVCDTLIVHPNVVNGADLNEMTKNMLYVEGSMLDTFLEGKIELKKVKSNKILLVVNSPVRNETVNAVSASRAILGINAEILELKTPLKMISKISDGIATGDVIGWEDLIQQVKNHDFDALAIASLVEIEDGKALHYFKNGGINPYGGVEAKCSKLISNVLKKPVAHAPIIEENYLETYKDYNIIVDPRISSEIISLCFLHCVLKGLHKAPRIGKGISVNDIDVLISPYGCWGRPHIACRNRNIPIIIVKSNKTVCNDQYPLGNDLIFVENYLEAVGVIKAMEMGISLDTLKRPIEPTRIIK